ncbi:hypothetical protein CTEN210_11864 [Chaetoceros tenuissimus]|uniref:Uncharacterized protein n=1 Tax=Chaetoceros tenuissimus TaxID=426638 RepID=A0AAD3D035_9STRA|nr:hypothetical protein CTEN210_11864 [Chaetoceros tenuissimus]
MLLKYKFLISKSSLSSPISSRLLSTAPSVSKTQKQHLANNFNNRRAAYKKSVGKLRNRYAIEIQQQKQSDEQALKEAKAKETRKRLERQRVKNLKSVKNAMRHEEQRRAQALNKSEKIKSSQEHLLDRMERFDKARQLVLNELEAESKYWLTTSEEVDAALTGEEQIQKLWSRPGQFIGAPLPSEDAEYWRFESHTWDMSKTYTSLREKQMQELEDMAYFDANLSETYWNDDRIQFQNELEEKAKLRALVREEGRKSLLMKQRQMMQDIYTQENSVGPDGLPVVPKTMAAPSLNVLADYEAMEKEGVKILQENPQQFFVFDKDTEGSKGKPLRLKDPVRDASGTNTPYPEILGRPPKADTRTEREKKRQEREERMLAAAQQDETSGVEYAADDEIAPSSQPLDYDTLANFGDATDTEWEEGLDPNSDAELLDTPRDKRFTDDDVEWMIEHLEKKIASIEELMKLEAAEKKSAMVGNGDEVASALGANTVKSTKVDDKGREYTSYEVMDDTSPGNISSSIDMSALDSLTEEQMEAIEALASEPNDTEEDIKNALTKVPGLSEEQIEQLVQLEMSLKNE